ncbi:MAG: hypothetical protein QN134_09225, partial [Armatimonadota bacterium]|nr:hypothetical protein [Armatimonadota bacterium]
MRIGTVDLDRVLQVHPRGRELVQLRQRILELEAALRTPLAPPQITPPPLPTSIEQVRQTLDQRIRAIQEQIRAETQRQLQAHAAQLRANLQAEM